jgi:branched-chain amino acid transport system permease protein
VVNNYLLHVFFLFNLFLLLGLSLQVTLGWAGLLNLGHVGLYAIGGYTVAILGIRLFPVGYLVAGLLSALAAYALFEVTGSLGDEYFALATMGFTIIVNSVLKNLPTITGGTLGVTGIGRPVLFGLQFTSFRAFVAISTVIAWASAAILTRLLRSPFGTSLEAVRDDERAAYTLGIDADRMRTIAMTVSGFFAGVAGALYAQYLQFISPGAFTVIQLMPMLTVVIVGGLATIRGTVLGSGVVVIAPELLRFFPIPQSAIGATEQGLYALLVLVVLLYYPRGIDGKVQN